MRGLVFGVEPTDAATFAAVTLLLVSAALVASYLPARRATRIDPLSRCARSRGVRRMADRTPP